MKNYIIILTPDQETSRVVEEFRISQIGQPLVDSLPPHITFKRRFTLGDGFSENDLINYFKTLKYNKFKIDFVSAAIMNDVLALVGKSDNLYLAHARLIAELESKTTTINPEWEGKNYKMHLTLLRGAVEMVAPPRIKQGVFDRLVLYEIPPGTSRDYARELASITLD